MSEGKFKKRKITALDAHTLVELQEYEPSDLWVPMKMIDDANTEYPSHLINVTDLVQSGDMTHKAVKELSDRMKPLKDWHQKWFGDRKVVYDGEDVCDGEGSR